MANYKNGKAAKVGDRIAGVDWQGNPFAGVVNSIDAKASKNELNVQPLVVRGLAVTAKDCVLISDLPDAPVAEVPAPGRTKLKPAR